MHDVAKVVVDSIIKSRGSWTPSTEWNYASKAGATCARELTYWRTVPEKALAPDPGLMVIFAHGNWVEKEVMAQLAGAGYEITEQDSAFDDRHLRLRGRIDCKIRYDGQKRPLEAKGYHPSTWAKLNTIDDFLNSDKEYLRKVPAQLLSYMLMDGGRGSELGILYLLDKSSGRPKSIPLKLEGDTLIWGEAMLQKIERVNAAVEKGELPDRIVYDADVCGDCAFRNICLTEIPAGESPEVLDPETHETLLDLVKRREELDPLRKEFKKLDERIGGIVKNRKKIILGDYLITGQTIHQKKVDTKAMPDDVKKKYIKESSYWKKSIVNMTGQKPKEE